MKSKLADEVRLKHILDAISEIEQYTENNSIEDFNKNSMLKFASVKQLEIIGEAANHISEELIKEFPEIKWRNVIGLRNLLVHEYFGIDIQIVWNIIVNDLPKLKIQIKNVLDKF
ncbi:MAG: DUF86 domain-containing protein [Calditrichia bacterium]|jgi:uncharacterized protein with HEPN domain|nr:DUF86 domain-containing protein [Calditrichia bacterium]